MSWWLSDEEEKIKRQRKEREEREKQLSKKVNLAMQEHDRLVRDLLTDAGELLLGSNNYRVECEPPGPAKYFCYWHLYENSKLVDSLSTLKVKLIVTDNNRKRRNCFQVTSRLVGGNYTHQTENCSRAELQRCIKLAVNDIIDWY